MNETNSNKSTIESLPIHDATLESAALDWKSGELRLVLDIAAEPTMAVLSFSKATRVTAMREQPWGRSVSVNEARTLPHGAFEVELQSGDTWFIHAASWNFSFPLRGEA